VIIGKEPQDYVVQFPCDVEGRYWQKRPTIGENETYYRGKRDLL
jgi:hypothetical protein